MNEYCQIVAQWLVQTKSWTEVELGLKELVARYEKLNVEVKSAFALRWACCTRDLGLVAFCVIIPFLVLT